MHKIKFFLVAFSLLAYIVFAKITTFLLTFAKPRTLYSALNQLTLILCRILKHVGGIKLKIVGNKKLLKERGAFFVANHVGYLDGIVLGSLVPGSFIAKVEILDMAYINKVVSACKTIFIDSRFKSEIVRYNKEMVKRLKDNINVLIFPEGHCSDGTKILPFYTAYFDAPLKAQTDIIPINIEYELIDGKPIEDREEISFYETHSFFPHLLNILKHKRIDVTVKIHDKIDTTPYSSNSKDRKFISNYCNDRMSAFKNQIFSIPTEKISVPQKTKTAQEINVDSNVTSK